MVLDQFRSSNRPPLRNLQRVREEFMKEVVSLAIEECQRTQKAYNFHFEISPKGLLEVSVDGEATFTDQFLKSCDSLLQQVIKRNQ
jgi:hypothetical protein